MIKEINQAGALAGSITPGDAAGFPVRISAAGSYILTGNLEIPAAVANAIEITASHVTINLNGFLIFKKNPDVSPAIIAENTIKFVKVFNGHIRGMGGALLGGIGNRVEGVQLEGADPSQCTGISLGDLGVAVGNQVMNVDTAFTVGKNGLVKDNVVGKAGHGVRAGENSIIEGNSVESGAAQASIIAGDGSIVSGNISGANDAGIQAGALCLVKDNTVRNNGDFGIGTGGGSVISGNRVNKVRNGPGITGGAGSAIAGNAVTECGMGIVTTEGSSIEGNAVASCTSFGMKMSATSGYALNVLNANNGGGAQVSGGFQVDKNECNGALCP
jgi:hypothetical protein